MKLFRETVRCRACGHQWTGYLHGFSRGHAVLVNGERVAFIPDDLLYCFPEHIDLGHDPAEALLVLGWRHMELCPACGARDFVAAYDQRTMRDVAFIPFATALLMWVTGQPFTLSIALATLLIVGAAALGAKKASVETQQNP